MVASAGTAKQPGVGDGSQVGQQVWRFGLVELTGIGVGELGERGWDRE
jgi:hypothetical protein